MSHDCGRNWMEKDDKPDSTKQEVKSLMEKDSAPKAT